ncbi:MAG: hypothetical protein PUK67_08230 [Prevotellaceae bacterium]|nr:hypothetical protein [Prevotellaceae bacterium]MDY3365746.1 hypothetical protein [Prevotella sp.]
MKKLKGKRTFLCRQMSRTKLAWVMPWLKNALFEEREKNVFVQTDEQNQACLGYVMAKRVDELASKTHFSRNEKRTF